MESRRSLVDYAPGAVEHSMTDVDRHARNRSLIGASALLAVVGALLSACGTSEASTSSTSTTTTATIAFPVPDGWTTYTFGRSTTENVAIAVPSTWSVQRDTTCPTGDGPGELILDVQGSAFCAVSHFAQGVVAVSQPDERASASKPPSDQSSVAIDGPTSEVIGNVPWTIWSAPSLGILINATGPYAQQVVHTLHRL